MSGAALSLAFPDSPSLRDRLRAALAEDLGNNGDVTSNAIFPATHVSRAAVRAKSHSTVAGLPLARMLFAIHDESVEVKELARDGDRVEPGTIVLRLDGATRSILAVERTFLNLLQRLSGVATLTRSFVDAADGRCAICDTRKTTPLWRDLEKYAVRCGGGMNHRMGLFDMAMLKDTHADGAGGLTQALQRVRSANPGVEVAAEARDLEEARAAVEAGVDLLMIDNMTAEVRAQAVRRYKGVVALELTGGVTLENAAELSKSGVDRISVGALTHSAPAADFSLTLESEARAT